MAKFISLQADITIYNMNLIQFQYFKTSFGELILGEYEQKICLCDWRYRKSRNQIDQRIMNFFKADFIEKPGSETEKLKLQLEEYFCGNRKEFDLELVFAGSNFQQKIWNELLNIEYGKTISYLQLSEKTGDKNAVRAVAAANGANAISIVVPCHRVIGSKGELTGYAGGLSTKRKLLMLEKAEINFQTDLFSDLMQ